MLFGPSQFLMLHTSIMFNYDSFTPNSEIRGFTINITSGCGEDDYCRIVTAYNYFRDNPLEYVYGGTTKQMYSPEETLEFYGGDCKSLSVFFASMMNNVGIFSRVDCDMDHNHCVTYVYPRRMGKYVVVDLTAPFIMELNKNVSYWDEIDKINGLGGTNWN